MACTLFVVKPATTGTFSRFRGDLFEIFWRERSYKHKKVPVQNNVYTQKGAYVPGKKKYPKCRPLYFPPTFRIRSMASLSRSIEAAYESRIQPGA